MNVFWRPIVTLSQQNHFAFQIHADNVIMLLKDLVQTTNFADQMENVSFVSLTVTVPIQCSVNVAHQMEFVLNVLITMSVGLCTATQHQILVFNA